MRPPTFSILTLATLLLPSVLAQVPASLSKDFKGEIQVSFKGDSAEGFNDGETIPFPDTANDPVFALGDASGVNTAISFMIIMIDTTDENNFVMHYLGTDFKASGEKTGLDSPSAPKVPYSKPGSFGETGARKYTFLLYQQKGTAELKDTPQPGGKFDYEGFGAANKLKPPTAGIAMTVNIGDTSAPEPEAGAAGGAPPSPSSATESSPPAAPPTTSTQPMTVASETPPAPSPAPEKNITSSDPLTKKPQLPPGVPFGGGIVSSQPFPAPKTNGASLVNGLANILNSTNIATALNSTAAAAKKAGATVQNGASVVEVRASASMAALVVMIGAFAYV
jgi:Phosphatidylethanolamine-binding protein